MIAIFLHQECLSLLLDIQSKHISDKLLHIQYCLAKCTHVQRNTSIAYTTINYFGNLRTVVSSLSFLTWQWILSVGYIAFILFFLFISYQVISHIIKLLNHQYTYNSSLYDICIIFVVLNEGLLYDKALCKRQHTPTYMFSLFFVYQN